MTVQTWDLVSRCPVATLKGNMKEITGLECSACGSMLAIANRSVVRGESDDVQNCHYLVDTRTNSIELTFRGVMNTRSNFLRLHFLGDNILYSGSENGTV